jgi:hypothetical protein
MFFQASFKKMCNTWFADTATARYCLYLPFEQLCAELLDVRPVEASQNDQTWPVVTHVMPVKIMPVDHPQGALFTHQGELSIFPVHMYDATEKLLCMWPQSFVAEIFNTLGTKHFRLTYEH